MVTRTLPWVGPAAGDGPRQYRPDAFEHGLAGLPPDVRPKGETA